MADLSSTLREALNFGVTVHATCPNEHDYELDLVKLADIATPFARLDEVVMTKSWCPICSMLASSYQIMQMN